ncbi:Supt5h, partial [Symbiodinium sp. KB8]
AGQEMEIMIALTNKFFAKAAAGQPLRIYSVVRTAKEHVYVEAENEADVQQAIQGIPDVYGWRPGSIKLIPVGEMTSVVSVPKRNQDLTRGAWVRFKRGAYKGDLAQVRDVLDGGARVLLMAVPRLDLSLLATPAHKRAVTGRARRRPPQRLFSAEEVKAALEAAGPGGSRSSVEPARHRSLNVEGHRFKNAFYADGFMLKEMKTAYVDAKDPQPTLAELNMFKPASGSSGLLGGSAGDAQEWERTLAQSLTTAFKRSQGPRAALLPGDRVAVVAGALEGVTGRVVSVNEAAETFMLDLDPSLAEQAGIHEHLEESLSNAIKVFEVGDHVKVVGGLHTGATGTVYFAHSGDQGTEHTAVIRLDTGMDQVQVFFRDLILSAERMADTESLEGHRKFDLVEVRTEATQQPQVGIVVGIQHRSLLIVDQMDRAHTVPVNMVRRNLSSSARRERALGDKERHIEAGTIVKVLRGKHKGLEATVKYVYRSRLFLHSNKVPEHAGCFALASRQVVVPGPVAGSASSFGRVLDGVPGAVGAVAGAASRKAKQRVDDEYRGKTVRVLKGLHRQKLGRVKQTLPDRVKVELHSTQKVITLQRSEVKVVEDESIKMQAMGGAAHGVPHGAGVSAAHQYGALPGGMTPAAGGGATPAYGSGATPAFGGGATPAYGGGATPAYGGGATPAYGGGATPAYGGGATPAYGGGATPAYGGGATPAYGGGATPAYSGGATPAYPGSDAAPASGQHQGTASSEQQEAQQAPAHCVPLATVTVTQGPRAGELAVVQRVQGADVLLRSTGVGGAAVSSFTILGSDTKPVAPTQKQERAFVFGGGHTGPGEVQDIADGEVVLALDNGQVADVRLADVVLLGAE